MASVDFKDRPKASYEAQQAAASAASAEASNAEALGNIRAQAMENWKSKTSKWRYIWNIRGQIAGSMIVVGIAGWYMVLPFVRNAIVDLLSYNRPSRPAAEALPTLSVAWWTNQWRKGVQVWRRGETDQGFYHPICDYIADVTGKDIRDPIKAHGFDPSRLSRAITPGRMYEPLPVVSSQTATALANQPSKKSSSPGIDRPVAQMPRGVSDPDFDVTTQTAQPEEKVSFKSNFAGDTTRPKALVPMCGDSPMVRHLADFGYNVDAVDGSDLAIRYLAENSEQLYGGWNNAALHRMQLFYSDIFEPSLWRALPKAGYDLIYDRQGISAIDPDAREDYAFLLKRALKPDGTLYIEGTFRTKRVHRVRRGGPPFHFGEKEITNLFPLSEGWMVKCKEIKELERSDLTPEARVIGQVPTELWIRHFPCVVWRSDAEARELMARNAAKEFT